MPSTSSFAGRAVPAAVISSGKNLPYASAATSAALYPATLACELSASMPWARDSVRGSPSRETAVTPRSARSRARCGSISGESMPMTACPARSLPSAASSGRVTVRMTSAVAYRSSVLAMVAPAAV